MQENSGKAFRQIWHWHPEALTPISSVWWFFLLFPRQEEGYGPKQIMFTLVSCAGRKIEINGVPVAGLGRPRAANTMEEPIPGMALGWLYDGREMRDGLVEHPCTIRVDGGRAVRAWDGDGYGGQIIAGEGKSLATEAFFRGERGEARFSAWGDPGSAVKAPTHDEPNSIAGGANVVAWRHLSFEGEFTSAAGTEALSGSGYFQRICLNIVPFPWKWMWATFADDSIFSCFVPFLGPHLLRRRDNFFPGWLENLTLPIQSSAYFARGGSRQPVEFSTVTVKTQLGLGPYPHFLVACRAEDGDFIQFRAIPYSHTQVRLERSRLGGWRSHYNYNEYPFRIVDLVAKMDGRMIRPAELGSGFGNCEYTWGLGL